MIKSFTICISVFLLLLAGSAFAVNPLIDPNLYTCSGWTVTDGNGGMAYCGSGAHVSGSVEPDQGYGFIYQQLTGITNQEKLEILFFAEANIGRPLIGLFRQDRTEVFTFQCPNPLDYFPMVYFVTQNDVDQGLYIGILAYGDPYESGTLYQVALSGNPTPTPSPVPTATPTPTPVMQDLLVASRANHRIIRYDGYTGASKGNFITGSTGGSGILSFPDDLTYGFDGNLYVISSLPYEILRYNGQTGAYMGVFASQGLDSPFSLVFGSDKNLYVSHYSHDKITKYDGQTGAYLGEFISPGSPANLNEPEGLAIGPSGDLYVCNAGSKNILRFDIPTGNYLGVFIPNDGNWLPSTARFGPDGHIYVSDVARSRVAKYNGTTGAFISQAGPLSSPGGLAFGPNGKLYNTDFNGNLVRRINPTTMAYEADFIPASGSGLNMPGYLVFMQDAKPARAENWQLMR